MWLSTMKGCITLWALLPQPEPELTNETISSVAVIPLTLCASIFWTPFCFSYVWVYKGISLRVNKWFSSPPTVPKTRLVKPTPWPVAINILPLKSWRLNVGTM